MIATLEPAAVLTPPAPTTPAPAPIQNPQSKIQNPPITPHDEALLETILIPGHSLFSAAKEHKLSLQSLLDWWAQPHIKAAFAALTDLGQTRARALAARHAASAVCWLQSAGTLTNCEFYESADSKTRLRAFESARKAAGQLLRLAGLPTLGGRPLSPPSPRCLSGERCPRPL